MIDIATERDITVLWQVALPQDREIQRLHARLAQVLAARGADVAIQGEFEAQDSARPTRAGALREIVRTRRGHGPTPQPRLPIVEQVFTLPADQTSCPRCVGTPTPIAGQFEESEEITVVERTFVVTRQQRQNYRCRCNGHVATAPGPVKLQEGARYSPVFAIEVATAKYLDHLPLERQVRIMNREGFEVTSQTLWDQIESLARTAQPTYEAIHDVVLTAPVIARTKPTSA